MSVEPTEKKQDPARKVFNSTENYNRYTITDILGLGKLFESGNGFWLMFFTLIVIGWSMGKC